MNGSTDRHIAIIYNDDRCLAHGTDQDNLAVFDVIETARCIADIIEKSGFIVSLNPFGGDLGRILTMLDAIDADIIFNLVESINGHSRLEAAAAYLFELTGRPFTGSPGQVLSLAQDKWKSKAVLAFHGIAVPEGFILENESIPFPSIAYPVIVKPCREDASHGINTTNVVTSESSARILAGKIIEEYRQPALVETYLPGREFNVALLGHDDDILPLDLSEIDYSDYPKDRFTVVSYAAKWSENDLEYRTTPSQAATDLPAELRKTIIETAVSAYRCLGLRSYGRVDIRLDRNQRPYVLEVNPNPDLSPDAGLAKAAFRTGINYENLIRHLIDRTFFPGKNQLASAQIGGSSCS